MSSENLIAPDSKSENTISSYQLRAAKIAFTLCTLLFFINYFFVGAGFFSDIFIIFIPYTYILFIFSLGLYLFFFFTSLFSGLTKVFGIIIFIVFALLLGIFTFPIIFKESIISFL